MSDSHIGPATNDDAANEHTFRESQNPDSRRDSIPRKDVPVGDGANADVSNNASGDASVAGDEVGADTFSNEEAESVDVRLQEVVGTDDADQAGESDTHTKPTEPAGEAEALHAEAHSNVTGSEGSASAEGDVMGSQEGGGGTWDADESDNPYEAYAALDPYADDADDADDGSDVTDEEARAYRTASQYSRVNAAHHYQDERKSVMLPVFVAMVAGVVVLAGVVAFLFGTRPATKVALDNLGITSGQNGEGDETSDGDDQSTPAVSPVDINLTMVGDVLIQPTVLSAAQTTAGEYDFSRLFSSVDHDISDADLALVDQESSMAGQTYGYGYNVPYNAPDSLATAEQEAGIDVVLKASNYALDLGYTGLHAELETWSQNESSVEVLGVADPEGSVGTDRVNNVYVYEKDGFKVAILNYTYGTDAVVSSSTDSSYVATLSEDKVKADVKAARDAGADMIVACPHWGVEYSSTLSDEQTTYGQLFADEGVDVVFGDHPHVVQPVEVLTGSGGNSCVCFYSVGNFVSGTRTTAALMGSLAKVTLHKDSDGTCSVSSASLVPVVTHRANTGFGVYRLSDYSDLLAQQGWDTYLTPGYVQSHLDDTLGLTYDDESGEYQVDLSDTSSASSSSDNT